MIKSLRHLFAKPPEALNGDQIIAFDGKTPLMWTQVSMRITAWELAFEKVDVTLVALYQRDTIEFIAALFALWRLGKQALVPANNLPLSCQQLTALTSCFAGDFNIAGVINPVLLADQEHPHLTALSIPDIHTDALVLFTSGSSSQPIPIAKSFAQLEAEIGTLEAQWGADIAGSIITSTVSHHHIYGLLFRMLWPLCSGRPFLVGERDYWEELIRDAQNHAALTIISSPAHLSRIPPLTWPTTSAIRAIFCSGAPLSAEAASNAKALLNHTITEVYGSTETGGIGWREQDKSNAWACLQGVEINLSQTDSLLQIRSPHLPDHQWFTSADQATQNQDGRFNLCGRIDHIAKIGGKRISLNAIERILEQQPDVITARVIVLPERGNRLGAAIVLSNDGNKHLVDTDKATINQQLRKALEGQVDRIALPRYWRYLGELPQNSQGKTTLADLQTLFGCEPLPRLPQIVNASIESNKAILTLFIPANLYYFDGHFPGRPVLPGVVQTHWAVHYAREYWEGLGEFSGLEVVKFQQVITANQTLRLELEHHADKGKLYFSYSSSTQESKPYASGRVLLSGERN